ncbi:helix-turn-helix transcriptional regulator [Bacillus sp. EB01]|uniref:helix-turn-helix transcriptional regulator n=1 Tax=Bacillus sp. EB01 TaxID=1347086 RepID=UPI0005C51C41|nr:helix-turn-helix domain-containing protein [Bacillus sp. EB01]
MATMIKAAPEVLLLKEELQDRLGVTKAQLDTYMKDGLPYFLLGNQYRFLESEITEWLKSYQQQERLEREFIDKKGRTLAEYVTEDIVLSTLRISKVYFISLKKKGMPFVTVGKKDFFHIQDILDYYRAGDTLQRDEPLKSLLGSLCKDVPREIPLLIVDGSYTRPKAGTGIVLIENWEKVTGKSNIRALKRIGQRHVSILP